MLDEENSRLKGLLLATTLIYILGWIIGLFLNRTMMSDNYLVWAFEHSWVIWLTWFCLFLVYCWIPLSIFLLIQGVILKRKYSEQSFTGDRTVGNLSILVPVVFVIIYVVTRLIYGS